MCRRKRVAVIGAGACGISAMKELKDEGIEPVCFEKTGYHGGLWRYHDDDSEGVASVMKTTIINTSKEMSASSNFPPPSEFPNFMHHTLMYEYITMIAEKADVLRHIKLFHQAVAVMPAGDYKDSGRWVVTTENTKSGERTTATFDGVVVCVGHHVFPNMPSFTGMSDFQGTIMHSHSLKKVDRFENQRVVVVGVGNSGMDAAVEISSVANQVYLSSRRGTWVFPKVGPYGQPSDAFYLRRAFHLLQSVLPYSLVCDSVEKELNKIFDHSTYCLKPKHRALGQHPTASDRLPVKLLSGTVVVRNIIKEFTKTGVIFEGDQNVVTEVEAVVFATGYEIKFPFFTDDVLLVEKNQVKLYKNIYPPHLPHPTLAICGLIQPNGPGLPPAEMQCRWISMMMSGKCSLPSKEEMLKDIQNYEEKRSKKFVDSPRHTVQVEFFDYQDDLASIIGAKPNFWKMALTDTKLFWAIMTGPSLPYQYRLQGPHAWEGARDAILTYNKRMKAPLLKPGIRHQGSDPKITLPGTWAIRMLILLPLLWWVFISVCTLTW